MTDLAKNQYAIEMTKVVKSYPLFELSNINLKLEKAFT